MRRPGGGHLVMNRPQVILRLILQSFGKIVPAYVHPGSIGFVRVFLTLLQIVGAQILAENRDPVLERGVVGDPIASLQVPVRGLYSDFVAETADGLMSLLENCRRLLRRLKVLVLERRELVAHQRPSIGRQIVQHLVCGNDVAARLRVLAGFDCRRRRIPIGRLLGLLAGGLQERRGFGVGDNRRGFLQVFDRAGPVGLLFARLGVRDV